MISTLLFSVGVGNFLLLEADMSKKIKIRNPYATALQKRHGGGIRVHKDKSKYTRKKKHKGRSQ